MNFRFPKLCLMQFTLAMAFLSSAQIYAASSSKWSNITDGDKIIALPCTECDDYAIKFHCTKGSPKLGFDIPWAKAVKAQAGSFQEVNLTSANKKFELEAFVERAKNGQGTLLSGEVLLNHPLVRTLSSANSATISVGKNKVDFKLKGSGKALRKLRKSCFSGKIKSKVSYKWEFTKAEYGEPNWITYAIPNTDDYIFGAFCQPKSEHVTLELFGSPSKKAEGVLAFTSYTSNNERGVLKGRINEFGWPQTSIKNDSKFWRAVAKSRSTAFKTNGKSGGIAKVRSSEPALQKFYSACSIDINATPQSTTVGVPADVFLNNDKVIHLSDILNISTMSETTHAELGGAAKVLNLKVEQVQCGGLKLGSLYKNLAGYETAPYRCKFGEKELVISAKVKTENELGILDSASDVFEEATSLLLTDFSWRVE